MRTVLVARRNRGLMRSITMAAQSDSGLVLPVVLGALVVLSALAIEIAHRRGDQAASLTLASFEIRAGAAAEAGLARAVAALGDPADPLYNRLTSGTASTDWSFLGSSVTLQLRSESGKVDVLLGNEQVIHRLLEASDPTIVDAAMKTLAQARQGQTLESVREIIPAERLLDGTLVARLERDLTVFSAQPGIDPLLASPAVVETMAQNRPSLEQAWRRSLAEGRISPELAAALGNEIMAQRPLYRIVATATLRNGVSASRAVLVTRSPTGAIRIDRRNRSTPLK